MVLNEPRESEQGERSTTDASEQPKDTLPLDLAALENRKKQLEIEKLEEEVKTSREGREWWRKSIREVKLSEWVTAIAAIVALAVAFWTGLFNSTREKLSAQADRLAIEQIELLQKKEKLGDDVAVKEKELTAIKERLLPYEQESDAIRQLRELKSKFLRVSFAITPDYDGHRVTIDGLDEKLDWSFTSKSSHKSILHRFVDDRQSIANTQRITDSWYSCREY